MNPWENDAEGYEDWLNEIMEHAPESYDDDVAMEAITVSYVRDLEELVAFLLDRSVATVTDDAVRIYVGREWVDVPAALWKLVVAHEEVRNGVQIDG